MFDWIGFLDIYYGRTMNRGSTKRAGTRVPVTLLPAGSNYPRVFRSDPPTCWTVDVDSSVALIWIGFLEVLRKNNEPGLPQNGRVPVTSLPAVFRSSDPTRWTDRIRPGIPAGYPGNRWKGPVSTRDLAGSSFHILRRVCDVWCLSCKSVFLYRYHIPGTWCLVYGGTR